MHYCYYLAPDAYESDEENYLLLSAKCWWSLTVPPYCYRGLFHSKHLSSCCSLSDLSYYSCENVSSLWVSCGQWMNKYWCFVESTSVFSNLTRQTLLLISSKNLKRGLRCMPLRFLFFTRFFNDCNSHMGELWLIKWGGSQLFQLFIWKFRLKIVLEKKHGNGQN